MPATLPWNTIRPPAAPGAGPTSTTQSAARIIASSCSTTTTVLPASVSERIIRISRSTSLECNPTLGSSRTNKVSISEVPRQEVRFTRSTSPPESVREGLSSVR